MQKYVEAQVSTLLSVIGVRVVPAVCPTVLGVNPEVNWALGTKTSHKQSSYAEQYLGLSELSLIWIKCNLKLGIKLTNKFQKNQTILAAVLQRATCECTQTKWNILRPNLPESEGRWSQRVMSGLNSPDGWWQWESPGCCWWCFQEPEKSTSGDTMSCF